MSAAWNVRPRGRHLRDHRRRRLPREQPEHPVHDAGDRRLGDRGARAGASIAHLHVREDDGTPSGRPELFVDVIDRIRDGRAGAPDDGLHRRVSNDMTIEERTTGLEAEARHLRASSPAR